MSFWSWFELPENAYNLKRFNSAMEGAQNASPPDMLLEGAPPPDSKSMWYASQGADDDGQDSTGRDFLMVP